MRSTCNGVIFEGKTRKWFLGNLWKTKKLLQNSKNVFTFLGFQTFFKISFYCLPCWDSTSSGSHQSYLSVIYPPKVKYKLGCRSYHFDYGEFVRHTQVWIGSRGFYLQCSDILQRNFPNFGEETLACVEQKVFRVHIFPYFVLM